MAHMLSTLIDTLGFSNLCMNYNLDNYKCVKSRMRDLTKSHTRDSNKCRLRDLTKSCMRDLTKSLPRDSIKYILRDSKVSPDGPN